MRLEKFLSVVTFITIISIIYVYQQTEIIHLAYQGQHKTVLFEELLDKNSSLRYNLGSSFSLVRIGSVTSGTGDFEMPDSYRLVMVQATQENTSAPIYQNNNLSLVSRIFGIKRQAEAKTINNPLNSSPRAYGARYGTRRP